MRDAEGDAEDVLVFATLGAAQRGRRRRGRHARLAEGAGEATAIPLTRATVVRAQAFGDEGEADAWLADLSRDRDARDAFAADALALLNEAIHAQRAATMDPYLSELGAHEPAATRIGYGNGDQLATGRWTKAVDAPPDPGRSQRRVEALRPQERVGAVLARRDRVLACETLVLRARADLDGGRPRDAAMQLEAAVRAIGAELGGATGTEQQEDLGNVRGRLDELVRLREAALKGELDADAPGTLAGVLEVCERILRRRRILSA